MITFRELFSRLYNITDSLVIEESAEQFEMDMWGKYNVPSFMTIEMFVAMLESIVDQSCDNRMKYMADTPSFCAFLPVVLLRIMNLWRFFSLTKGHILFISIVYKSFNSRH